MGELLGRLVYFSDARIVHARSPFLKRDLSLLLGVAYRPIFFDICRNSFRFCDWFFEFFLFFMIKFIFKGAIFPDSSMSDSFFVFNDPLAMPALTLTITSSRFRTALCKLHHFPKYISRYHIFCHFCISHHTYLLCFDSISKHLDHVSVHFGTNPHRMIHQTNSKLLYQRICFVNSFLHIYLHLGRFVFQIRFWSHFRKGLRTHHLWKPFPFRIHPFSPISIHPHTSLQMLLLEYHDHASTHDSTDPYRYP